METIIEAETAAVLAGKLLQMASEFIYDSRKELEEGDKVRVTRTDYHLHDHKMDALDALVENLQEQGENIAVVYHFKPSLARLQKRYPKGVVMDKEGNAVTPWNKGKIPILFVHAQSAGHGLNLQKGRTGHDLLRHPLVAGAVFADHRQIESTRAEKAGTAVSSGCKRGPLTRKSCCG